MTQKKQDEAASRKRKAKTDRREQKRAASGRVARLSPEQREQTDATTIALCYWLLAQRIVQEAEDNGDLACPDPDTHDGEGGAIS